MPEERTDLAWQRTGLGILAVAGLLAHRAVVSSRPAFLVAAGVAALLGLLVLGWLGPIRHRRLGEGRSDGAGVGAPRLVAGATAIVLLVGVVAAVAVLVPR